MSYEEILYDVEGHVATITLNCPERMNSFSDTLLTEWADAITKSAQDENVRAVIITGTGRAFCAGANLKARAEEDKVLRTDSSPVERRNGLRFTVHQVARALHLLDKPYIAAVNGAAVGAGMDMCSMADIRIASDKARFSMSYVNVGLIPGDGGAWLLPRLVGLQKAAGTSLVGRAVRCGEKALEIGYLSKVVPHDDLMDETRAYAEKLAAGPPIAMQLTKRLVYRGLTSSFLEAMDAAQAAMTLAQTTEDAKEGPRAFVEKRPAPIPGPLAP